VSGAGTRTTLGLAALCVLALAACTLRLLIDRGPTGPAGLAWPDAGYASFRWTAMAAGAIVGSSLAVAGVLLQALLRNPLAEPFILGVSTGAGLGVMAALYAAHAIGATMESVAAQTGPAVAGALAALAVVYLLGQRRGFIDPVSLVLIGVILSTICGAGIMLFQHLVPTGLRGEFTTWLMGRIPEFVGGPVLAGAGGIALLAIIAGLWLGRAMDAATLIDDEARSVGLALGPLRLAMFALAGVLAAMTVAIAGPIGFVGLIGPHAARLVLGPRHGPLVPGAALAGVALVVGADVARQAIDLGAGRLPIGIFTALIGGPAFLGLLRSRRGQA
jgi:iron complex transport system permease protein